MKKKRLISVVLILVVFLLCSYLLIDQLTLDYQTPKKKYSDIGYVYFDPISILHDLDSNLPVFTQEIEYDANEIDPNSTSTTKIFSEDEYLYIAERFFEINWNENVSDWNLINKKYVLYDCNLGFSGNVLARYQYEKQSNDYQNKILKRDIAVIPWANTISWSESILEYSELASTIQEDVISISAKNAFQISKQYGNEHLNEGWDEKCDEIVLLLDQKRKSIWYVDYRSPFSQLISVEIDASTGKIKEK